MNSELEFCTESRLNCNVVPYVRQCDRHDALARQRHTGQQQVEAMRSDSTATEAGQLLG